MLPSFKSLGMVAEMDQCAPHADVPLHIGLIDIQLFLGPLLSREDPLGRYLTMLYALGGPLNAAPTVLDLSKRKYQS